MRAVAELHLAAEAAEFGFAQAKTAAHASLTTAMHESGCPGLYCAHHHVTPTEGARRVIVTDQAALAARHLSDRRTHSGAFSGCRGASPFSTPSATSRRMASDRDQMRRGARHSSSLSTSEGDITS